METKSFIVKCLNLQETQAVAKFIDKSWSVSIYWQYVAFFDEANFRFIKNGLFTSEEILSKETFKNVDILSFADWQILNS